MKLYVVQELRHESYPDYVASSEEGALAHIRQQSFGVWAISEWRTDVPSGVSSTRGRCYVAGSCAPWTEEDETP